MSLLTRQPGLKKISTLIRFFSTKKKNYYEILKVRKDCTDKEIKEAFIQMSKEYHPDKNKNVRAQEHFVNIVEAYNVLSKPGSRAKYDSLVEVENPFTHHEYQWKTYNTYSKPKTSNYNFYYDTTNTSQTKNSSSNENSDSYYGIAGIKRLPNFAIVILCFGFAVVGLIIQMFVIKKSFLLQQKRADEHTKKLAQELDRVRATAVENGNELQAKLMVEKIVTAANPTIATASLGHALANEKK